MRFAKSTFLIAGIYGLFALLPMYLTEEGYGAASPPPINHPEFYYGFIGVAVAFQLVFLIISRDPVKYRVFIVPSIIEKFSFAIAVAVLVYLGRTSGMIVIGAAIDGLLGILFTIALILLSPSRVQESAEGL